MKTNQPNQHEKNAIFYYILTLIDTEAFIYCTGLTSIEIPTSITRIENNAFYESGLTVLTLPSSITEMGYYVFAKCASLERVFIEEGVKYIGRYAFDGCTSLTSIKIPSSVYSIGDYSFAECNKLKLAVVEEGVSEIGEDAFFSCDNLERVVFTVIENFQFFERTAFVTINSHEAPPKIITVSQDAKPSMLLNVSASNVTLSKQNTANCYIESNTFWDVTANQTWLSVSPNAANESFMLTITAFVNDENSIRSAKVTISAEGVESQSINVTQDAKVGIDIFLKDQELILFPNPVKNAFSINGLEEKVALQLTDIKVKILIEKDVEVNEKVGVSELMKGIYFVSLTTPKGSKQLKMVK